MDSDGKLQFDARTLRMLNSRPWFQAITKLWVSSLSANASMEDNRKIVTSSITNPFVDEFVTMLYLSTEKMCLAIADRITYQLCNVMDAEVSSFNKRDQSIPAEEPGKSLDWAALSSIHKEFQDCCCRHHYVACEALFDFAL